MARTSGTTNYKEYLQSIENALKAGNATEHTHRPALKTLLESLGSSIVATNQPTRIACGAPDYIISQDGLPIGYIEAKDVGKSLNDIEGTDQFKRYRRALGNLILTDYLEFRWYTDGELRQETRLAWLQSGGKLKTEKGGVKAVDSLLHSFLSYQSRKINTSKDLAERMACLTHIIHDSIISAFETGQASSMLREWREAFDEVLIADLNLPEKTSAIADMFAQTVTYGLLTARVTEPTLNAFSRREAQYLIPKSNSFLRDFVTHITGPQLDDEPFAGFVDDLVNLFTHTDMEAVLAGFGRRTRQEDPIAHFYESFLAAYDPKLREARGVHYTLESVDSYIVRSVDYLLKTRFDSPVGLADILDKAHETTGLPHLTRWVANEMVAANGVKQIFPVLVVMGHPPYSSHSDNKSSWINELLKGRLPGGSKTSNYYEVDGKPLGEKNNKWLQANYVKFIRFGQWRIDRRGAGVMALISNNGYLDSPAFRGMRQSLTQTFTEIFILDLHGNIKKKEITPDSDKDKNVFDIQQGVAIGIFVKQPGKKGPAKVFHSNLWGIHNHKYEQHFEDTLEKTTWEQLNPQSPFHLFVP